MDAKELKNIAIETIDAHADDLFKLSHQIWENPELKYEEFKAHNFLTSFFAEHQFLVEKHLVLETGFRCRVDHGDSACVAVLCEYDALPEIGHACGHNLIAEAGAGAALGIKAAMEFAKKHGHSLGKLYVVGTPAEEGGNGKGAMLRGGAFDGMDVVMMTHPSTVTLFDSDSSLIAFNNATVTYHGKASHASVRPFEGINALDATVMAYNNISAMRQQMKSTWRVACIITHGGLKVNITPQMSSMYISARAPTINELDELKNKLESCFNGAATATGCTVDLEWEEATLNVRNNKPLLELYKYNAESMNLKQETDYDKISNHKASTDMGNLTHFLPGIHPVYQIKSSAGNHQKEFTKDTGSSSAQPETLQQAKIMAMTTIDVFLQAEEILPKIKKAFLEDIKIDGKYE